MRQKKKKNLNAEPYWHLIRKLWVIFNRTHLKFSVEPIPERDYSHLHRIVEKIKDRTKNDNIEWTETEAIKRIEFFLTTAYTKDKWLKENFLLANLESKMQKVFNLIENPNGDKHTVGKTIVFD